MLRVERVHGLEIPGEPGLPVNNGSPGQLFSSFQMPGEPEGELLQQVQHCVHLRITIA